LTAGKTAKESFRMIRKRESFAAPCILALAFGLVLAASCENADPPEDFGFVTEGNVAYINRYKGNSLTPRIPSRIQGKRVTRIDEDAFSQKQLTGVTIPNGVTSIGDDAFYGNHLTGVTIPDSVTSIGGRAFMSNQLTSLTIPNSVTSIGERVFAGYQLSSVTIPNSVTSIGESAFSENQLTSVTIPDSVTSISPLAFSGNQLTSVTIGANVSLEIGGFDVIDIINGKPIGIARSSSFDNGFGDFYNDNGRKAGTYTYSGDRWSYQQ
jgi:hypothetical protein